MPGKFAMAYIAFETEEQVMAARKVINDLVWAGGFDFPYAQAYVPWNNVLLEADALRCI